MGENGSGDYEVSEFSSDNGPEGRLIIKVDGRTVKEFGVGVIEGSPLADPEKLRNVFELGAQGLEPETIGQCLSLGRNTVLECYEWAGVAAKVRAVDRPQEELAGEINEKFFGKDLDYLRREVWTREASHALSDFMDDMRFRYVETIRDFNGFNGAGIVRNGAGGLYDTGHFTFVNLREYAEFMRSRTRGLGVAHSVARLTSGWRPPEDALEEVQKRGDAEQAFTSPARV